MLNLNAKRILLTGSSGFLGRHVLANLERFRPAALLAPSHAELDLLSASAVQDYLKEQRPDLIIHCAARVGGIGANRAHPGSFFYDNLMMGVPLMEAARQAGVEKFVAIGTICAYPKHTSIPFREQDLWSGYPEETNAPYGLAKKMLLVQAQAYRQEYGFNAIYLLPVNLYGPGDNFDPASSHVIPALMLKIWQARKNKAPRVTLWGDGSPTREFLYVEDAARGIVLAAQHYDGPEPINLGSGREISIRDLAEKIKAMLRYEGDIYWDTSQPNGQPRRCLDTSRAEAAFGFAAETPFESGLQATLEWFEAKIVPGLK
jgi:GDP-L-fucose synthase